MLIAKGLLARGHAATLFAPASAIARLGMLVVPGLEVVDFSTLTSIAALQDPETDCWTSRLPSLDRFDCVVSDNLPEILKVRRDAVLSGSFLWHLVLAGIAEGTRAETEDLLARHRPVMIASELFGMPELAERTRLTRVGLCVASPPPPGPGEALLISCGGTSGFEADVRRLVETIATGPRPPFSRVFVEPRLIPDNAPAWMERATFDETMYRALLACVCRPGVGTMTDCVWARARVFSAWEPGNRELSFNASRFAELGIGESAGDPHEAFAAACAFATDADRRAAHTSKILNLDLEGVRETADVLTELATSH